MERILCIFEGEKTEEKYFSSLKNSFFSESSIFFLTSFKNDIYALYKEISNDDDLDIFELIKESKNQNIENIENLTRDQISQIYLFFDYECHDPDFSEQALLAMLGKFDNETEHGKLFISYPMVEAIRDITCIDSYLEKTVSVENSRGKVYKRLSADRGDKRFQDTRKIDKLAWLFLIEANSIKASHILYGEYLPESYSQIEIARKQIELYLPQNKVAVLSHFPLFLIDYLGHKRISEM